MEDTVSYVEELCDLVEDLDPNLFHREWRKVSIPASVAAIRVLYYVERIENTADLTYKRLHYLLTNESQKWNNFTFEEKQALLERIGIPSVMVYTKSQ